MANIEPETSRATDISFEINKAILQGTQIDPFVKDNDMNDKDIVDRILRSFESRLDFIAQVDAETGEQNTFQQMRDKSVKCAHWLRQNGIQSGDAIMYTHNQLNAYVPFLATLYIGATAILLDEYIIKAYFYDYLSRCKPEVIFIDERFVTIAKYSINRVSLEKGINVPRLVALSQTPLCLSIESIMEYYKQFDINNFIFMRTNINHAAIRLFSSSTINCTKDAVEIPYAALMASSSQQAPFMPHGDIGLWFESLGYIMGIFLTIQAIILRVKVIKIRSAFHTKKTCEVIQQHKVTWMFLETSMCNQLIKSADLTRHDVSSLKTLIFGGPTINRTTIHAGLIKSLPNTTIIQVYYLTETGIIAYQRETGKPGSSGYVAENVRLKITNMNPNKTQTLCGPRMAGVIWYSSAYMTKGYHKDPNFALAHHKICNSNWFNTGDIGYYDEDGDIFVITPLKQVFKNRGELFIPAKIEIFLQNHIAVSEVIIIPVPYGLNDRLSMVFVMEQPGEKITKDELKEMMRHICGENKEIAGVIYTE